MGGGGRGEDVKCHQASLLKDRVLCYSPLSRLISGFNIKHLSLKSFYLFVFLSYFPITCWFQVREIQTQTGINKQRKLLT